MARDVRLDAGELLLVRELARRRLAELDRRLRRSSYAGKPGMLDAVLSEQSSLRELAATFEAAHRSIGEELAAIVKDGRP